MTAKLHWFWALLLLPTRAEAAGVVTHRGNAPNTFNLEFPFITDVLFDINTDGTDDFRFTGDYFVAAMRSLGDSRFISVLAVPPDSGGYIVPVTVGSILGADTSFLTGNWHRYTDNSNNPALAGGYGLNDGPSPMQDADAYIGVEFLAADGIHYGWIQYTGYSHPENGLPAMLVPGGVINSWAWETQSGVPIVAGAIPEPGTAAYIGGSAILLWQRNANTRKQNKALQRTPRGLVVSTLGLIRKLFGFGGARVRP